MLKQTIETIDLDGKPVVEEFYFNLTEAELVKLHLSHDEGMVEFMQAAIDSGSGARIIALFEELTRAAYGRRSADNRLIKKPEWFDEIAATEAYSNFFMQLVTDAGFGTKFVNGIMPPELMERARLTAEREKRVQDNVAHFKGESSQQVIVDEASLASESAIEEMSDEDLLRELGAEPEPAVKNYLAMSPAQIRKLPRHELVEAMRQKQEYNAKNNLRQQ